MDLPGGTSKCLATTGISFPAEAGLTEKMHAADTPATRSFFIWSFHRSGQNYGRSCDHAAAYVTAFDPSMSRLTFGTVRIEMTRPRAKSLGPLRRRSPERVRGVLWKKRREPGNIVNVASTPVALAARAGAPKPDISTADAFKQTLLSAKSISYADPAKGGLSGVVASRAIERLGIAEQMKSKTTLVPGAQSPDLVAKGEVELGIAQASEIVPIAGAQLVGPLPGELGSMTQFSGGIGAESASASASKALIDFLAGQEAGSHFKAKGFEPGG